MKAFAATVVFVLAALNLSAQTTQLSGTVTDPSRSAVADATVQITSPGMGLQQKVQTDQNGLYTFPLLKPGQYELTVTKAGFQSVTQQRLTLEVGQQGKLDIALQLGATTQSVTVSANSQVLAQENGTLGQVVSETAIVELPLNGRNPASLVTLANGAIAGNQTTVFPIQNTCCAFPTEGSASVNGGREGSTVYYLDGAAMMDPWHVAAFPFPNPDATQEFRVSTNNFDSRYGNASSGVVNIATQSGLNDWHGTFFEFNRNTDFNAANFFSHTVNQLKRNQFGGAAGGRVIKDKLFVFANFQETIERLANASSTDFVATAAELQGNFGDIKTQLKNANAGNIPFAGNQIPTSLFNPISLKILQSVPTSASASGFVVLPAISENDSYREFTIRADYDPNSKNQISVRSYVNAYNLPGYNGGGTDLIGSHDSLSTTYQNEAVNWTYTISPNLFSHLTLAVGALRDDSYASQIGSDGKPVCLPCYGMQIPDYVGYPPSIQQLSISGYFTIGGNTNIVPRHDDQISEQVNWVKGKQLIVAGVDVIRQDLTESTDFLARPNLTFTGQITGNAMADFLLGEATTFQQAGGAFGHVHGVLWGGYVNDTIHLRPNFTLTLGMRWEPFFPPTVQYGRITLFRAGEQSVRYPNAPEGLVFPGDPNVPAGGFSSDLNMWEPRVGVAWQPSFIPKTSVRAAFGIFSAPNAYSDYGHTWQGAPFSPNYLLTAGSPGVGPYVNFTNPYGNYTSTGRVAPFPPFDSLNYMPAASTAIPAPVTLGDSFQSNFKLARIQTWNFSLEHQIASSWLIRAAYVGSEAYHLQTIIDLNPGYYSAGGARLNYTSFGQILQNSSWGTASYNALQLSVEKHLTKGLEFTSNYTYSKDLDSSSLGTTAYTSSVGDPFNLRWNRGTANTNFPNIWSSQLVYTLPRLNQFGKTVQTVLGSWEFSGLWAIHSGQPFSIQGGRGQNSSGAQEFGDRAQLTGQPFNVRQGSQSQWLNEYFNTAAFAVNPPGTFGDEPRNPLTGPRYNDADLALTKNFLLTERIRLQLRWEAFNALNHPFFSNPGNNPTNPGYGQITSSSGERLMQLGGKLNW